MVLCRMNRYFIEREKEYSNDMGSFEEGIGNRIDSRTHTSHVLVVGLHNLCYKNMAVHYRGKSR